MISTNVKDRTRPTGEPAEDSSNSVDVTSEQKQFAPCEHRHPWFVIRVDVFKVKVGRELDAHFLTPSGSALTPPFGGKNANHDGERVARLIFMYYKIRKQ
ncbi:hypothetical protein P0D88_24185 [Paraburkholderia sp. RL18-103-BIB-C]